jgi:mediator of RNA polymerase II transcription subunit 31
MEVEEVPLDQELSEDTKKFILDLEFVQCLANPEYLKFLSQHENRYFQDDKFVAYLKYLQYWKSSKYVKYIAYPHCLYILDLLQDENFRNQISQPGLSDYIYKQQYYQWKYYRNHRLQPSDAMPAGSSEVKSEVQTK